jgi:hypothetical protein
MDFIFHIIENKGILVKNKQSGFIVRKLSNTMMKNSSFNKVMKLPTVPESEDEVYKSILTSRDISLQFDDESSENSSDDSISNPSKSSSSESSNMGCNISSNISKLFSLIA